MAENQVTIMVLKVDLQCEKCYKKIKKVLRKFPQIRDQKYDEKANTVTITVVCCSPEKIRDKICRKDCGVIKSIEILPPPKPLKPLANQVPQKEKPIDKPEPEDPPPKKEEPKKDEPKPSLPKPAPPKVDLPPPPPPPATGYPSIFPMVGICLVPYCIGYGGGSGCHHGHERPAPCYDGCGCGCGGRRWQSSSCSGYSDGCRCGCGSGGSRGQSSSGSGYSDGYRCGCGSWGSRGQSSSGFGYSDGCGCGCGRQGYYYEENPQTCRIM